MTMLNRRDFMKVAGVTAAAGAVACDPRVPMEKVLPYVVQPEQIVPGLPTWFATQCNECSAHCGVEAKNREGRIIKLEGNRQHPANNGRLCAMGLAGLQSTYSPDRFAGPMIGGQPKAWPDAQAAAVEAIKAAKAGGKEVAWLGHARTGATGALIEAFIGALGGKPLFWEPASGVASLRAATKVVFGKDTVPSYDLSGAHTVLSFGAEFLSTWGAVELRQGWAAGRDPKVGGFVSRTVCVEPRIGNTSCVADLHLQAVPGSEAGVALAIAKLLAEKKGYAGLAATALSAVNADELITAAGLKKERVAEVVGWLAANPSVVLPGGAHTAGSPTALAVATLLLNDVAGNIGTSVYFGQTSNVAGQASAQQVVDLFTRLNEGKVGVLFLDGSDPAYNLPSDVKAFDALAKATVISFANEANDSLTPSAIVLPGGTTLESWGDAEARSGWHTLQQATMRPLKDSQQLGDTVLTLAKGLGLSTPPVAAAPAPTEAAPAADATAAPAGDAGAAPVDPAAAPVAPPAPVAPKVLGLEAENFLAYLKSWWAGVVWPKAGMPGSFEAFWVECLQRGGWFQTLPREGASVVLQAAASAAAPALSGAGNLSLVLFPHPFIYDGRHANKPWAQEIPEPLSSFTWGTWAEIHPKTAESLGLTKDDKISVKTDVGAIEVGWFASPGIREDVVAVVMGNGQQRGGRYTKWGANPASLISSKFDESGELQLVQAKASVSKAAGPNLHPYLGHINTDGRGVNFAVSINDLGKGSGPASIVPAHHVPIDPRVTAAGLTDMYPEPEHPTYRFAMAVDLNRCTGCGACETACFSENNTPVVGPDQVRKGRHMGWIRLSRYWEGTGEQPDIRFQPVICQQCSHAPCEGVCPVLATYHNLDGLNAMVYNRCVGTRYCGNNCPYTARRFNYHNFRWPESFHLMLNPDVSTREVGVMEKCSFCVQRLRAAKDQYRDNKEVVPEKALLKLTACAQACPTDAITFGNANDKQSALWAMFQDERTYTMLGELNTKPGVRYMARINHVESALHHGGHGGGHGGGHATDDHGGDHGEKAAPSGAHH
jgi:Fe-S-cluster-containing dehydrogenase component/anaerobic selenocysteine-containing dehydrogenase